MIFLQLKICINYPRTYVPWGTWYCSHSGSIIIYYNKSPWDLNVSPWSILRHDIVKNNRYSTVQIYKQNSIICSAKQNLNSIVYYKREPRARWGMDRVGFFSILKLCCFFCLVLLFPSASGKKWARKCCSSIHSRDPMLATENNLASTRRYVRTPQYNCLQFSRNQIAL